VKSVHEALNIHVNYFIFDIVHNWSSALWKIFSVLNTGKLEIVSTWPMAEKKEYVISNIWYHYGYDQTPRMKGKQERRGEQNRHK